MSPAAATPHFCQGHGGSAPQRTKGVPSSPEQGVSGFAWQSGGITRRVRGAAEPGSQLPLVLELAIPSLSCLKEFQLKA